MEKATEKSTHFGFKTIDETQKQQKVNEVFHSVASKYDVMNDVMSAGLHRVWKRFALDTSGVKAGDKVLDIAGGSGDLSKLFSAKVGATGSVILTDINASMLAVGRDRMIDAGLNVPALQCDAEQLPFADNSFDCVIVAFGLRNMTHKELALKEKQIKAIAKWSEEKIKETYIKINGEYRDCVLTNNWLKK